jgi:phenylacetate-CoA ligase
LLNEDMPLIRYHTGDRGAVVKDGTRCGCGRAMPILTSVEGRTDDILYTSDGRWVGRLDPAFKSQYPIREAQVIQESIDRLRFRYVPAEGFDEGTGRSIVSRLQARMGPVHVTLEPVQQIPREPNGKFRAVICRLSAEERAGLQ